MYKQAPEAIGIYSNYKIIGRIEEKEMKRNSKRFLALFLSVAMTVTPAVLTQAENEDANVQVSVTPTPETEAEKTAVAAETPVQDRKSVV